VDAVSGRRRTESKTRPGASPNDATSEFKKETRRMKIPERVIKDDDRGIADVADDLRRPSEDQHADWAARKDAASGRRRTDPRERTGASPNSATSSEGENRSRSSGYTITSGSRKSFGSSEKMGNRVGDASQDYRLRSEARLQGAASATLGLDKSSRTYGDRTVNGGTLQPMTNDGKISGDTAVRTSTRNTALNRVIET
jgi:hypothetical protein